MNVLWYLFVCGIFFGGAAIYCKSEENKKLKEQLRRATEQEPVQRKFRSITV